MQGSEMEMDVVRLESVGQVAITVRDVERATIFYRDVLGLPFLFGVGHLALLQCGSVRLMLSRSERFTPGGGTIVYFKVSDLQETCSLLKAKAVVFVGEPHLVAPMATHDLWMAFFEDPDGNTIGLMCEVSKLG